MKICTGCKQQKHKDCFSKNRSKKDGLKEQCKQCDADYRLANKKRVSEYNKFYQESKKESIAKAKREYRIKNKDQITKSRRVYLQENKTKLAESKRLWRVANPEKAASIDRNRRARKSKSNGVHTHNEVMAIYLLQRGLCANCKTKLFKSGCNKFHIDHIVPLALGGGNDKGNIQCLCPHCNLTKGAKHPCIWASENGRLL